MVGLQFGSGVHMDPHGSRRVYQLFSKLFDISKNRRDFFLRKFSRETRKNAKKHISGLFYFSMTSNIYEYPLILLSLQDPVVLYISHQGSDIKMGHENRFEPQKIWKTKEKL